MQACIRFSHSLATITLLIHMAGHALAGSRVFKGPDGTTITAEVIAVKNGVVTLQRADGRRFSHPLDYFSQEDRASFGGGTPAPVSPTSAPAPQEPPKITNLPAASYPAKAYQLDVRVGSRKSNRQSQDELYDDRSVRLRFYVDVTSRDPRAIAAGKGTLIILGKSAIDVSEYAVLSREEFALDVTSGKPFHFDAKEFTTEYDDKGGSSRYGFKYFGYILVLQNAEGQIVRCEASPEANTKHAEKALKLPARLIMDRDLDAIKGPASTRISIK